MYLPCCLDFFFFFFFFFCFDLWSFSFFSFFSFSFSFFLPETKIKHFKTAVPFRITCYVWLNLNIPNQVLQLSTQITMIQLIYLISWACLLLIAGRMVHRNLSQQITFYHFKYFQMGYCSGRRYSKRKSFHKCKTPN